MGEPVSTSACSSRLGGGLIVRRERLEATPVGAGLDVGDWTVGAHAVALRVGQRHDGHGGALIRLPSLVATRDHAAPAWVGRSLTAKGVSYFAGSGVLIRTAPSLAPA